MTARKPTIHPDDRRMFHKYAVSLGAAHARTLVRTIEHEFPSGPLKVAEVAAVHALIIAGLPVAHAADAIGRDRSVVFKAIPRDWRTRKQRKLTAEQQAQARDLWNQGHSAARIARMLGVSRNTIFRLHREDKWPSRPRPSVANLPPMPQATHASPP